MELLETSKGETLPPSPPRPTIEVLETIPGSPCPRWRRDQEQCGDAADDAFISTALGGDRGGGGGDGVADVAAVAAAAAEAARVAGAAAGAGKEPQEARPKLVQWVKSHEWQPDQQRQWTDDQRREMRWLIHDATEKGVTLQSSDFVAMFPSFPIESIQRSAVEELMTTKIHPPPKKLAWLSQLVIDGDEPSAEDAAGAVTGPDAATSASDAPSTTPA